MSRGADPRPVLVGQGDLRGPGRRHPGQQGVGHQRRPDLRRDEQSDDRGDPTGELGSVGTRPDGRGQAAYADELGQCRTVEHHVAARVADPLPSDHGGQVDARRQLASLLPEPQPLEPGARAALEATTGPDVGQHLVERAAQHHDWGAPPVCRATGDQVLTDVGRLQRVADDPDVLSPRPRQVARTPGQTERDDVLREHTRGHSDQLVGGQPRRVDRLRSVCRTADPEERQVGLPATRRCGGQHATSEPLGQVSVRDPRPEVH